MDRRVVRGGRVVDRVLRVAVRGRWARREWVRREWRRWRV